MSSKPVTYLGVVSALVRNGARKDGLGLEPTTVLACLHVLSFWKPGGPWPYMASVTLSEALGLSERHVKRIRQELVSRGLLELESRRGKNTNLPSSWNFSGLLESLANLKGCEGSMVTPMSRSTVTSMSRSTVTSMSPNTDLVLGTRSSGEGSESKIVHSSSHARGGRSESDGRTRDPTYPGEANNRGESPKTRSRTEYPEKNDYPEENEHPDKNEESPRNPDRTEPRIKEQTPLPRKETDSATRTSSVRVQDTLSPEDSERVDSLERVWHETYKAAFPDRPDRAWEPADRRSAAALLSKRDDDAVSLMVRFALPRWREVGRHAQDGLLGVSIVSLGRLYRTIEPKAHEWAEAEKRLGSMFRTPLSRVPRTPEGVGTPPPPAERPEGASQAPRGTASWATLHRSLRVMWETYPRPRTPVPQWTPREESLLHPQIVRLGSKGVETAVAAYLRACDSSKRTPDMAEALPVIAAFDDWSTLPDAISKGTQAGRDRVQTVVAMLQTPVAQSA